MTLLALGTLLAFSRTALADLVDIRKGAAEPAVGAGAVLTYTIEVDIDDACSVDVTVLDSLPVDAGGNLLVEYLSSSCTSECGGDEPCEDPFAFPDGIPVEPCLNGEGALNDDGELLFVFPGEVCPAFGGVTTLLMTVVVRTNANLEEPDSITNCAEAQAFGEAAIGDCETTQIIGPDLTLTKVADPVDGAGVEPGERIRYTLTVSNGGTVPVHGVVVQDVLPVNVRFVAGSASPSGFPDNCTVCGVCTNGSGGPCPVSGGIVAWQYDILHVGESRTLTFEVRVNEGLEPGEIIFNVATAFDANGRLEVDSTIHTVNTPCLSIDKRVGSCRHPQACNGDIACAQPDQPGPGDIVTYEIEVSNADDPGCATAEAVQIVDPVPAGMGFEDCSPDPCFFDGVNVLFLGGSIAPGTSITRTMELRVDKGIPDGTKITNVATAEAESGAKDSDSEMVTVRPPKLNLRKIGTPHPIEPGGVLNYIIRLSNSGVNCAHGVDLHDDLPRNAVLELGSITSDSTQDDLLCDAGGADADGGGTLFLDTDPVTNQGTQFLIREFDLDAGESCTVQFRVRVPENTVLGTEIVNEVTVEDEQGNGASDTETTPANSRLIGLSKIVSGCTFPPGGPTCNRSNPPAGAELTYTITVTTGPFASTNTRVIDTLPDTGVAGVATLPSLEALTDCPNWDLNGNVLTCFIGDLAAARDFTFRVTILLNETNPEGTVIVNSVQAVNDALDDLHTNNIVIDEVAVVVTDAADEEDPEEPPILSPDLEVEVISPNSVKLGRAAKYGIVVTNTGDETANAVTLTSTVPAGARIGRLRPRKVCRKSEDRSSFTCNIGNLAPGQRSTIKVKMPVRRRLGANVGDQLKATFNATCNNCGPGSGSATATMEVTARRRKR